jgi:hypothetical protein
MATRFYHSIPASIDLAPSSWSAGWNVTSGGVAQGHLGDAVGQTTWNVSLAGTGVSGQNRALARFVSAELKAQTISGSAAAQLICQEAVATDNYTPAIAIKVITSAGADRGVLLAVQSPASTEFSTATVNRSFKTTAGSTTLTLSSLAVSDGDRIVVEYGFNQTSTSTGLGSVRWCGPAGRPDAQTDLPIDESATTGVGWIEFTQDIEFREPYCTKVIAAVPIDVAERTSAASATNATATLTLNHATWGCTLRQGDLIIAVLHSRLSSTFSLNTSGGQTWTNAGTVTGPPSIGVYWCQFNGTFTTAPIFNSSSSTNTSGMLIRVGGANLTGTWAIDTAMSVSSDATSSYDVASWTPVNGQNFNLAVLGTQDDNSWSHSTSAPWTDIGMIRNVASTDASLICVGQTQVSATATGILSMFQNVVTGDTTHYGWVSWYQGNPVVATPTIARDIFAHFSHLINR